MNSNLPGHYRFGGGAAESTLDPAVIVLTLVAIVLIVLLPRKYIIVPFLAAILLVPFGQQLYIAGAHVFVGRILILVGWFRLIRIRSSLRLTVMSNGVSAMDKIFLLCSVSMALATVLESMQLAAVVNQIGFLWDSLGAYFLFRFLIRDDEDIATTTKTLAVLVCILALTMMDERFSNHNVFGYIGGQLIPAVREGAIRAQGPFVGPIPAGTFGATLFCLFIWLWRSGISRRIGLAGTVASMLVVVASASSTPLMTVCAGLLGMVLWPLRSRMRLIRWGIVCTLIILQLVMNAPVWMLINHLDLVGGNSSFHRAMLIDGFVRHFGDWWLVGVESTASWGYDLWDQANQFVAEGEKGGLLTFICFVSLICIAFRHLGIARRRARGDRQNERRFWFLGCALFSFVVSFFGISFSDQTENGWYVFLAIVCAATLRIRSTKNASPASSKVGPLHGGPLESGGEPKSERLVGVSMRCLRA